MVAIKIFEMDSPKKKETALASIRPEVEAYNKLNHPNLVRMLAFKEDAMWVQADGEQMPVAYMVLELMTGRDIFDFIVCGGAMKEKIVRFYFS